MYMYTLGIYTYCQYGQLVFLSVVGEHFPKPKLNMYICIICKDVYMYIQYVDIDFFGGIEMFDRV